MHAPKPKELPRLIRYVSPGTLPGEDLLSVLDPEQNILRINRGLFVLLSEKDQRIVLRTQKTSLTVDMATNTIN